MSRPLRLFLFFLVATLLSACAGTHGMVAAAPAPPAPGTILIDSEYVALVQSVALRRGVDVHWVNPPIKRVGEER